MENTVRKIAWYSFLTLIMVVGIGVVVILKGTPAVNVGGVTVGNEYSSLNFMATTTFAKLIDKGAGTLGSIVINTLGTGYVIFYDASSTNSNLRTTTATTSLRVVAVQDASQAAGTYTYDINYNDGLIAVFSGAQGTSTLMYR